MLSKVLRFLLLALFLLTPSVTKAQSIGAEDVISYTPKVDFAVNDNVTIGSSSTSVLSDNPDRQEIILVNDSDEAIYVTLGATAVMNTGIRLNANGGSLVDNSYTGPVSAICSSGSKILTVVEK